MGFEAIKRWFRQRGEDVEDIAKGGLTVTIDPAGSDEERETSTNQQVAGAAEEPWPDRE